MHDDFDEEERAATAFMTGHVENGPVMVSLCDGPWQPALEASANALERKRAGWRSDERNDQVAAVAQACAERGLDSLQDLGLFVKQDEFPILPPGPSWIALLVELPEHGRELSRRLPAWHFRHAIEHDDRTYDGAVFSAPWKTIDTLLYASECEIYAPDIIVAAGCNWAATLENFPGGIDRRQRFVIDLADDFDELAEEATYTRLRAYTARGWDVCAPRRWMTSATTRPAQPAKTKAQRWVEQLCNLKSQDEEE